MCLPKLTGYIQLICQNVPYKQKLTKVSEDHVQPGAKEESEIELGCNVPRVCLDALTLLFHCVESKNNSPISSCFILGKTTKNQTQLLLQKSVQIHSKRQLNSASDPLLPCDVHRHHQLGSQLVSQLKELRLGLRSRSNSRSYGHNSLDVMPGCIAPLHNSAASCVQRHALPAIGLPALGLAPTHLE